MSHVQDKYLVSNIVQVQIIKIQVAQKTSSITVVLEVCSTIGPMFLQLMGDPATCPDYKSRHFFHENIVFVLE